MSAILFRPLHLALGLAALSLLAGPLAAQNNDFGGAGASTVEGSPSRPVPRDRTLGARSGEMSSIMSAPKAPLSELQPIYFPAALPVLGAELPPPPSVRDPLWTELAAHANELYFSPLSTRLADGSLHRRLRQRLDTYQAARAALLADLRRRLEAGAPLAPEAAETAKLAELTAAADALRHDLYAGGFLIPTADWNQHRNWRLGEEGAKRTRQELLFDEMSVVRAAIYYQEGLIPEQRELLREIVFELNESISGTESSALADAFDPEQTVYFLPHGSRLRLPAGLPAAAAADLAEFTAAKNALKRELRETLYAFDRESDGKRLRALQDLAARQQPRLAALEPLAERIRVTLATLPDAGAAPAVPGLPAALAKRIDAYLRAKADLQNAARKAGEVTRAAGDKKAAPPAASPVALQRFEEENRQRFAELAAEARAIREEVARAAAQNGTTAGKSVETLLADFMAAFKQQQLQALYQDYRTAVLRPGLTPAQRQLLFNAAIAALDLTGIKDWQAVPE